MTAAKPAAATAARSAAASAAAKAAKPAAGKAAKARQARTRDEEMPAAGPHAKPHLMDPDRTPGAGSLAEPGQLRDGDATG